ncbi:hypothetical protein FB451DRAFT_1472612 [Mycena latifolia]|nr:hypothetical protein FB451DRAFT_1472612 [Mycena latifolia]
MSWDAQPIASTSKLALDLPDFSQENKTGIVPAYPWSPLPSHSGPKGTENVGMALVHPNPVAPANPPEYSWSKARDGFPPIWSESRQELCETMPWFRRYQGGVYQKDDVAKGYMLSEYGATRDCFKHGGKFIISHGGGGRVEDLHGKLNGQVVSQEKNDITVRALLKNYADQIPLVLIVDDKYPEFPLKLGEKGIYLAVLGFYMIVDAWAELHEINGTPVVRYKFAFQWCAGQDEPWWHAERSSSGLPNHLDYNDHFLELRNPPQFPTGFDTRLMRERLDLSPADGLTTKFNYTRGWHCENCGRVSSRWAMEKYECGHCHAVHRIVGVVQTASSLQHPPPARFQRVDYDLDASSDMTLLPVQRYKYSDGWGIRQSFQLPDNRGTIHHIRGSASVNKEADHIFEKYQRQSAGGSLLFRRWPLKTYVGGSDQTVPLAQAPSAVVDAHKLITTRLGAALGQKYEFNEVLSVAYLEKQKMAFHSDDEKGLGPVVAGLSLGSPAVMHFRLAKNAKEKAARNKILLTVRLEHGDILVMEGAGVQEYYQHTVVPDNYRIAVTARHISTEGKTGGRSRKAASEAKRKGKQPARYMNVVNRFQFALESLHVSLTVWLTGLFAQQIIHARSVPACTPLRDEHCRHDAGELAPVLVLQGILPVSVRRVRTGLGELLVGETRPLPKHTVDPGAAEAHAVVEGARLV